MPCDDIQRRMIDLGLPQSPRNLATMRKSPSRSSKAATGARKSRGFARPLAPIGAEIGKPKWRAIVLADVAAGGPIRARSTRNLMPRGMTQISPGATSQDAEFGVDSAGAKLRHNEQFAIGIVEIAIPHGLRWRHTGGSPRRFAWPDRRYRPCVTMPSTKSVGASGDGQWIPAQLVRRRGRLRGKARCASGVGGISTKGL